jgi:hypothetical protein
MIYNFYHIFADGLWQTPVTEYLEALKTSGLYDNLKSFNIGIVGSPENRQEVIKFLNDNKINYTVVNQADSGWEQVTQDKLYEFATNTDGYVLYSHTKGSSHSSNLNNEWRRNMVYFTVTKWKEAINKLKTHLAVGSHWLSKHKYPKVVGHSFFGGTFWWTTLENLRNLGPPPKDNRYGAEYWIGLNIDNDSKIHDMCPGWPGFTNFKYKK